MAKKLKSDIINYGFHKSIRIDYIKNKKGDGKVYVDVVLVGEDSQLFDQQSNHQLTSRFYGSKEHARSIVLPVIKSLVEKRLRDEKIILRERFDLNYREGI